MKYRADQIIWVLLRIFMGWIFLWAFLDKLFGLGFATKPENAWLLGKSPTEGFLKMATHGPFVSFFDNLAGSGIVDWLFMLGLLLIGLALILGIGIKIASYSAVVLLSLMYLSLIPPANNPVLDEHIIYILVMIGIIKVNAGQWFGFGKYWANTSLVKKYKFLQ